MADPYDFDNDQDAILLETKVVRRYERASFCRDRWTLGESGVD